MKRATVLWVNCGFWPRANRLGEQLLKERLAACMDVVTNRASKYFWPPQKGRIEKSLGSILFLTTLPPLSNKIVRRILELHDDEVPFIGKLSIEVTEAYALWLRGELFRTK